MRGIALVAGVCAAAMLGQQRAALAPSPSYQGRHVDTASVAAPGSYTFAGAALGTPHAQRVLVLNVACGGIGATLTITVAGNATTFIHRSGSVAAQQHYIHLPTGSTGDIVVTVPSGTATHCWVSVHAIYPHDPLPWFTGNDNDTGTTDSVVPLINLPKDGHLIYFGSQGGALGAFGTVWDGTATVTEDVDEQADGVATYSSGHAWGSTVYETATRSLTLQETVSGTKALHVAVWGPDSPTIVSYQFNGQPADDNTDASVFTFPAADLGSADAGRLVVVAISVRFTAERTVSSVTIGGVSAAVVASRSGTEYATHIYAAIVPTGTTGDIVVTWSGTIGSSCACGVRTWSLYNLESVIPYSSGNSGFTGTTDATIAINERDDGVNIYGEASDEPAITHTWSNATERYDGQLGTSSASRAGADYVATSTASPGHTETVQESATSGRRFAYGHWR